MTDLMNSECRWKLRDWVDIDNLDWQYLSKNPNAIHIIKDNINNIDWDCEWLYQNPFIFEYDYEAMRDRMKPVAEELMANRFHPKNFEKFVSWGFDEFNLDL